MLVGAHVSPAGGLYRAVERGTQLGARAIQIFNQSPRAWRPTAYGEDDFARFREARAASQVGAVLIHAVYLVNCASEESEIAAKSLASLTHSLRVGDAIGATAVVVHPGSAKGGPTGPAIERAGALFAAALADSDHCPLHWRTPPARAARSGALSPSSLRCSKPAAAALVSGSVSTPATCSPPAMRSAHRRR